MAGSDPLDAYREKRNFGATPEPSPGPLLDESARRFVITRHSARALHFDLRLEADGVLVSWAVPKGLPLREGPKRLAVQTEDHPLEYLTFEGVIPEGQYGGGLMTIWDHGAYDLILRSDDEWKVTLHGEILQGEYHLVRTGKRDGKREWLCFRSTEGPPGMPDPAETFASLRPMLASLAEAERAPLDDPNWAVELKWDGYRALALVTGDGVDLRSRRGLDLTTRFPDLGDLRRGVRSQEAILDGEIVVLDEEGRADFGRLQAGLGTPVYVVFDVLYVDGTWQLERPLSERRDLLATVLDTTPVYVMPSDDVRGNGRALLGMAVKRGVEGVVAKRLDSPYRPGERDGSWIKVKAHHEIEARIGGYTTGSGARRASFGAVLLGMDRPDGLAYVGSAGSGFTDAALRSLRARLDDRAVDISPFSTPVDEPNPTFVRPDITCRIRFTEWTRDGRLRHPVFLGLAESEPTPTAERPDELSLADGDRSVGLTNLNKVFWPRLGITKGDVIDHYLRMAPHLVDHLKGRPLILKRFPNGIAAPFFFQHNLPENAPTWLRREVLSRSDKPDAQPVTYGLVDDPLGLMWVVNLGCIDMNPWQSRVEAPDRPTQVLLDLDPADGLPFDRVVETALLLRDLLAQVGLRAYPKTTGASGMHLFVPIEPELPTAAVMSAAQALAAAAVTARPDLVSVERLVAARGPRVYIDALQNGYGKSISSVYSLRPVPGATVATPLDWDEVRPGLDPGVFTMGEVARRVSTLGDLFAPTLTDRQDLAGAVANG